jgi:ketosteroid isomerase-like protein
MLWAPPAIKETAMNPHRPLRFAVLAAALAFAGAAVASEGPLDGMSKAFEDAMRKGDTTAVAAMYAEDGVILPPNHARVQGREGIAAYMKGMTDAGLSLKLAPGDSWIEGSLGVRSGSYIVLDKEQKEIDHGKWLEVWRKGADGKWLMVSDMWNSDDPPPPPADDDDDDDDDDEKK